MNNRIGFWRVIGPLGITQVISWGSLFYAFTLLGPQIQRELAWRSELVFGAFSWSLLVAGLVATPAGILIDRWGGRSIMAAGSLVCAAGLVLLSHTTTPAQYYGAWTLLGIGMALVLYEAAFAAVNHLFAHGIRTGISTLTLFGGFASTVFWPLSLHLETRYGWRSTYLAYGLLQLLVCLPLHLLLPRTSARSAPMPQHPAPSDPGDADQRRDASLTQALRTPAFWLLATAFASNSFIFAALSMHLIPLLHRFGHPLSTVVLFGALIGPMQVAGRIGEMLFARHTSPHKMGMITFGALPVALAALLALAARQWVVALFCILYGLSNGIVTIVRGTVPQALFGRENYGAIAGALSAPGLLAKAAGPMAVAALLQSGWSAKEVLAGMLFVAIFSLIAYLAGIGKKRGTRA